MKRDLKTLVGENIRKRRTDIRMSQRDLCETAQISVGFLSDVENGKRGISVENLYSVADVLNQSMDWFCETHK